MANIYNLNTPNIPKLERRVRAVESGAPMNNAGVGRSGFEVYDNGTINVSNGNIIGAGIFNWQGSFDQAGDTSITGPLTVTGGTTLNGKTDIGGDATVTGTLDVTGAMATTGTLSVEGEATLKSNLNVTSGGKITAGNVTIDPSSAAGAIDFANGAQVASVIDRLALHGPGGVDITGILTVSNAVTMSNIPTAASTTGMKALYIDAAGKLYKAP